MAKIEIDNDKMWESILQTLEESMVINNVRPSVNADVIIGALKDQGLQFKDGHIISILEQDADFKIEKGKWYICIQDLYNTDGKQKAIKGRLYFADKDDCIANAEFGMISNISREFYLYFRPATEEEITKAHPEWNAPVTDNYDKIKQAEQDTSELTEFENRLGEILFPTWDLMKDCHGSELEIEHVREYSKELLSIARKQFIEEVCEWIKSTPSFAWPREELVEYFRKALEK